MASAVTGRGTPRAASPTGCSSRASVRPRVRIYKAASPTGDDSTGVASPTGDDSTGGPWIAASGPKGADPPRNDESLDGVGGDRGTTGRGTPRVASPADDDIQ